MIELTATYAEVQAYLAEIRKAQTKVRRSEANRSVNRTCTSCGETGHVRGNRVCPNYGTAGRWLDKGERWRGTE